MSEKLLTQVQSGKQAAPRRVMLYGVHGVGKSTFASCAPSPIFIQTEDGLGGINCNRFPLAETFDQVMAALAELYTEPHQYQTVVLDSLDWLERLIWEHVCHERKVGSVEDFDYGKGYVFALTPWRRILKALTALRGKRGMTVLLIAHSRIERFNDPETESYDRYAPCLQRLASALVQEWCDEVLFANYRVFVKVTEGEFNKKLAKGHGTGERIIRTTERPAHLAKNRLGLPEELPLDWKAYARYLPNRKEDEKVELATPIQVEHLHELIAGLNIKEDVLMKRLAAWGAVSIETLSQESAAQIILALEQKNGKEK